MTRCTIEACDELGLERIALVGHSLGGNVAARVAQYELGGLTACAPPEKRSEDEVGLANGLVAPSYNDIQKKSVDEIAKCKNVAQFMDRDTVPDMANAMIKLIQQFIDSPTAGTIASIQKSAEDQAKTIFT